MSGSPDYTLTPNLGLFKPNYDMDDGQWGNHLNSNADVLDSALSTGSGGMFLPIAGGVMSGALSLAGNATSALHAVPLQQLNAATAGGPFLPSAGGSLSGALGLWGASSSINTYDAQIWATGGATVPGNPGQGELNYMAGRHVFQGYDGTTQFRIANIPWSWQWWEASGGSSGGITTLRAGSDLNPDCSGAIAMQGHGNLTIGNGEGTIAQFMNINAPIINYIQFQPGGYNQGVGIRAAGGDGLPASFAIGANYNGSVIASNSNGPMMVIADAGASGVSRSAYFVVTAPTSGQTPSIALSTTGITSPPTTLGLNLTTIGNGGFSFSDGNGPLLVVVDGQASGVPVAAYLRVTTSAGGGPLTIGMTAGSATNATMNVSSLGTGTISFVTNNFVQARVVGVASASATVDIYGAVSGGSPAVRASAGNLLLGLPGLATTATAGMIQLPTCPGTPTGTPSNAGAGATLVYDNVAHKIWVYDGSSWRGIVLT